MALFNLANLREKLSTLAIRAPATSPAPGTAAIISARQAHHRRHADVDDLPPDDEDRRGDAGAQGHPRHPHPDVQPLSATKTFGFGPHRRLPQIIPKRDRALWPAAGGRARHDGPVHELHHDCAQGALASSASLCPKPGDYIEFEALMDCLVGLSNCPLDVLAPCNGYHCTPVKVTIFEGAGGFLTGAAKTVCMQTNSPCRKMVQSTRAPRLASSSTQGELNHEHDAGFLSGTRRCLHAAVWRKTPPPRARSRSARLNSYKAQPAFLDPYKKGWELAIEEINAKGGVLGKKLEVVSRDDGANPGDAVRVADELVTREGVEHHRRHVPVAYRPGGHRVRRQEEGVLPRRRTADRQDHLAERQPLHLPPAPLDLHAGRDADPARGRREEEALGDRLSELRIRPVGGGELQGRC